MISGKTRNYAWWLAAALIIATNLIVLFGAAYNRSGEEQGHFEFSQRELSLPWRGYANREDSGLALRLNWRMPTFAGDHESNEPGLAPWLDEAKMRALGFALRPAPETAPGAPIPLPRDVWLVLQFDGKAHQRELAIARRAHDRALQALSADPSNKVLIDQARGAEQHWLRERDENSRLFVIDAGLDPRLMRQQYPDRSRYLIAGGTIRASWGYYRSVAAQRQQPAGYVHALNVSSINVPARFRTVLEPMLATDSSASGSRRFTISIAYGRRYEPWIVDIRPG